jgi:hypothetical protein
MAPVMKIMPELLELCGGVLTPPCVEEVRPGSHESSYVACPPCLDAAVSLSPESDRQMIPIDDGVLSLDYYQRCPEQSLPGSVVG